MCGFAGFRLVSGVDTGAPEDRLRIMADSLRHRGPDADGVWFSQAAGVGLAHRRLSIQDISPSGAQPMVSDSGRYVIAFNGEIYNFTELRDEFVNSGHRFRGHSDTEVMLACFEQWGVPASLEKFEGMFAFALFDAGERMLYLARDRLGEKPLYYGWNRYNTLLFGSELKALRQHPDFDDTIDRNAIALLLKYNYIPAPHSIYRSIRKLEPGCYLSVSLATENAGADIHRYWEAPVFFGRVDESASREEYTTQLESLLKRSIRQQMISDVPLGAFLSGGVDSSAVVALMQSQTSRPVKTFCIGFNEKQYNEAVYAKNVAAHLGTDHTELYIDADDSLGVIPSIPTIYDEPFADSSQIPTFLISKLARQDVTVSLSGDGGDELFCGYERYFEYMRAWQSRGQSPSLFGRLQAAALETVPRGLMAPAIKLLSRSQRNYSLSYISEKIERHNGIAHSRNLQEFYERSLRYWYRADEVVLGANDVGTVLRDYPVSGTCEDGYRQLMLLDILSYLPDDILVKVDRAAMANSLETRVPFLNHRIVEFAATVPAAMQTDGVTGKHMLRDILYRYVPQSLIERPKQGFAVPLPAWLRSQLKDWAATLLDAGRLRDEGFFDERAVSKKWHEHLTGHADHSFHLWGVLVFQAWLEQQKAER